MLLSLALMFSLGATTPAVPTTYDSAVLEFGSRLLTTVAKDSKTNSFVSPISAHMALSMLANGLSGTTKKQVLSLLGVSEENVNTASSQYMDAMSKLAPLTIANGCWSVGGTKLSPSFTDKVKSAYQAELGAVQVANGADIVNDWVKDKTKGRIENLLQPLDNLDRLVLANAIAFDGKWKVPFNPRQTREAEFKTGESNIKTPMMRTESKFLCGLWGSRQVIELLYDDGFEMLAILPASGEAPLDVIKQLNSQAWATLPSLMQTKTARVYLPKFKTSTQIDLEQPLSELGANRLFIFSHDFDGLVAKKEELAVSQAVQKVFIEVDEKGTKAAAATVIVSRGKSAAIEDSFTFNANRPFVVILMDTKSRVPIIMGIVNDPSH